MIPPNVLLLTYSGPIQILGCMRECLNENQQKKKDSFVILKEKEDISVLLISNKLGWAKPPQTSNSSRKKRKKEMKR